MAAVRHFSYELHTKMRSVVSLNRYDRRSRNHPNKSERTLPQTSSRKMSSRRPQVHVNHGFGIPATVHCPTGMKWEFESDPAKTRSRSKRRVEVVGPEDIALFACQRLQDNSRAMTVLSLHDAIRTRISNPTVGLLREHAQTATRIAV